jgi:hypothetical protein
MSRKRIIQILSNSDVTHLAGPFPEEYLPTADDYVGYFMNWYGEEMVYVGTLGASKATLYHSDLGWL